jgi:hypothetical protein
MSLFGLILSPALLFLAFVSGRDVLTEALPIGIEDLLFGFSLFGIAAIIYHVLLGKHIHKFRGERLRLNNPAIHYLSHLVLILGVWVCLAFGSMIFFDLSPLYSLMIGGLFIGIYLLINRHDLLVDALLSGLMTSVLVFLVEQFYVVRLYPTMMSNIFSWDTLFIFLTRDLVFEQFLWATVVGFTIGPLYEWLRQYRLGK